MCGQIAPTGTNPVLDLGFWFKERRDRVRNAMERLGLHVRFHYLDVPAEIRWKRVKERNEQKGVTYEIEVTRGMFDFFESIFEIPAAEELEDAIILR